MSKKTILIVLLLATCVLVFAGVSHLIRRSREFTSARPPVSLGAPSNVSAGGANLPVVRFVKNPEPAPALQARDLLGNPVTKENWSGKVVLVNFWATWCPPCREEIPELLELEKEYKDRLQIVGISEDDDPPAKVMKFVEKQGMTYPIVMATPELIDAYGGVPALPTSFLIDTQGRVVQKHSGLYPIESYRQEIRSLLGVATDVRVETFEDTGQVFLKNASNATELPGVDFTGLSPEQKKLALHRLNAESCTCGCKLTLSQCRVNDGECPTSRDLAAQIVRDVSGRDKSKQPLPSAGANSITMNR
jgi:thiol-disulfide isomerase/thioredoxin